jgi:nucleotide-binding universal stress UspA family protein
VHDLPVTIAHATDHPDGADDELRRQLAEVSSGYAERYPDVWAHTLLLSGRPARKLLVLAERMHLLVVGQHEPTGLHESPFGHVRSSIVDRSPCPTAVVPVRVEEPA